MEKSIKRMGIFIFYDEQGIADDYIDILLNSIGSMLCRLVIIVNGKVREAGYKKFQKYSREIFVRENKGYDAGGYKDAVVKFFPEERWSEWDEVVLLNDTFYGPFCPWEKIFEKMCGERADFWGLSRHPEGKFRTGEDIRQHIQGYFLVCRKSLLKSKDWIEFWKKLPYPQTYYEAVVNFEIYFTQYFEQHGFTGKAYTDYGSIVIPYDTNPTIRFAYELISQENFPVVKRKIFTSFNFDVIKKIWKYIDSSTTYDVELIKTHLRRLQAEGRVSLLGPFNSLLLEKFYLSHKRIFIYGNGQYAKRLDQYFKYKKWSHAGFLVTEKNDRAEGVFVYRDMSFFPQDGVVLGLGRKALNEVYPMVSETLNQEQILIPDYKENTL